MKKRIKEHRNRRLIAKSGLFDEKYYLLRYPDIRKADIDPIKHYLKIGAKELRNPSADFDTKYYLENNPDVEESGINPLVHYSMYGRNEQRKTKSFVHKNKLPQNENKNEIIVDEFFSISNLLFKNIKQLFDFKQVLLSAQKTNFNASSLDIHFVVPDFSFGGGGHMNIFRLIYFLEYFGHRVTIWIYNPLHHKTEDEAYQNIVKNYFTIKAQVKFVNSLFNEANGDVIIATSWDTVWPIQSVSNFKRRFYFVQDYEPFFYPKGTHSELAKYTYTQDLDCICASTWLNGLMQKKFGRWSIGFNLAADKSIFYPIKRGVNKIPKIVLYSRLATPRGGVELAIIALELLAKEGYKFHVDLFGVNFNIKKMPFSACLYKTSTPKELAQLYREADIGIVFSLTNYSLVPQEMMACALPVIEFDNEITKAIYPDDVVEFAGPTPLEIKEKIKTLLENPAKRDSLSRNGLQWVSQFSWEKVANTIEESIVHRLIEIGFKKDQEIENNAIKTSIIIPTHNGLSTLKQLLKMIASQNVPWNYEIIILDSESNDGTKEFIETVMDKYKNLYFETIGKVEFGHGKTRNYGASISQGEYLVFVTQDIIPYNEFWLYNLVTTLEHYPNAAGAFSKHMAHDNANFFVKEELINHFKIFDKLPFFLSYDTSMPKGFNVINWQQKLHFYSDNSSCMRKNVWEKIPYRDVQYGEDQLWAYDCLNSGYGKVYVPSSIIKHSHNYEPKEVYERSKINSDFFNFFWNYKIIDEKNKDIILEKFIQNIKQKGFENNLPLEIVSKEIECKKAMIDGYVDGLKKRVSLFAEGSLEKSKF